MTNVSSSYGKNNRPKLSFRAIDGSEFPNWRRTSLGTIIEPYSEKVYGEHDYEVLTSSRDGLQRQIEHFGSKQRHDTDGYNIIPLGFCTYRNRSDDGKFVFNINTISNKAIVSKFYPVFRFINANSTFMTEYLNSSARAKKKLSVLAVGTSQVVLSFAALRAAKFDLPCKEEQNKIASLLECLNKRISKQRAFVKALKKYKRGAIKRILSKFSCETNNCTLRKISSFATCVAGATPDTKKLEYWDNGTIPWLSSGEVNKKRIYSTDKKITSLGYKKTSTKMLPIKTVVIALAGQGKTRGTVAITENEVCTNQSLAGIITDSTVDSEYLFYYLETQYENLRILSSGDGTRGGLNLHLINEYLVPVPCLEMQKSIASVGTFLDCYIDSNGNLLSQLHHLKAALMQKLFI